MFTRSTHDWISFHVINSFPSARVWAFSFIKSSIYLSKNKNENQQTSHRNKLARERTTQHENYTQSGRGNMRVEIGTNMKRGKKRKKKGCMQDGQPKCEIINKSTKTLNEGPGQRTRWVSWCSISDNLMVPQHGFNVKSVRKCWETAQKSDQ